MLSLHPEVVREVAPPAAPDTAARLRATVADLDALVEAWRAAEHAWASVASSAPAATGRAPVP